MASETSNITELVEYLVTSLVDDPKQVEINSQIDGDKLSIAIRAAQEDVGKVIGRNGRTIKSIRTLARAAAGNTSTIVEVDVEG
ncbi:MAG: KH domain-containing protein [Coriobacteriia bacterium]|nr:KH domain-containing protein [Coriobacteriia bacterium]